MQRGPAYTALAGSLGGQAEERQITERVAGKRGAEQRVIWHLAAKERGPRLGAQHHRTSVSSRMTRSPRADLAKAVEDLVDANRVNLIGEQDGAGHRGKQSNGDAEATGQPKKSIFFDPGGFAPRTPDTLTRGGPSIPAPFARPLAHARALSDPGASPRGPPTRSLAGAPRSPAPFAGLVAPLVRFLIAGGFAPRTPSRSLAGPLDPRSVRVTRSLRFARFLIRGLRPADPRRAHSRDPYDPRSVRATRSLTPARFYSGGFAPRTPTRSLAGTPRSPLRSRDSLARSLVLHPGASPRGPPDTLTRGAPHPRAVRASSLAPARSFLIRGLRPADPPTRSLAGTPIPAPFA